MGGMANCGWISIDRHRSGAYWRIEAYNAVAPAAERTSCTFNTVNGSKDRRSASGLTPLRTEVTAP